MQKTLLHFLVAVLIVSVLAIPNQTALSGRVPNFAAIMTEATDSLLCGGVPSGA